MYSAVHMATKHGRAPAESGRETSSIIKQNGR